MIDWNAVESARGNGGQYKEFIAPGIHKAKVTGYAQRVLPSGSIAQEFTFDDVDGRQLPKTTAHWLSFKNENWRLFHQRQLMMLLGCTKEQAQKGVESAESKDSEEAIAKTYAQLFEKLVQKSPEVEIEAWLDDAANGKTYTVCDFTDPSVRLSRPEGNSSNSRPAASVSNVVTPSNADTDVPF